MRIDSNYINSYEYNQNALQQDDKLDNQSAVGLFKESADSDLINSEMQLSSDSGSSQDNDNQNNINQLQQSSSILDPNLKV